jgi:hypothetical protein
VSKKILFVSEAWKTLIIDTSVSYDLFVRTCRDDMKTIKLIGAKLFSSISDPVHLFHPLLLLVSQSTKHVFHLLLLYNDFSKIAY